MRKYVTIFQWLVMAAATSSCVDDGVSVDYASTLAYAGEDRTAQAGQTVALDGSASKHRRGDSLSYTWIQLSGPRIDIPDKKASRLTITFDLPGEYVFRLIATDSQGLSSTDDVKISVQLGPDQGNIEIRATVEE